MTGAAPLFAPRLTLRRRIGAGFEAACVLLALMAVALLGLLLTRVAQDGWRWLSSTLLTQYPSTLDPASSGIKSAVHGTVWLLLMTAVVAVPVGVAAAVYLEEYARNNRLTRFIHLNIANLAGVPSIVYGLLGLTVFVRWCRFDRSVISGALTLSLLVLPVIIIASREALRAVPTTIREAAYALGASRWQMVWHHVLPAATPGIMTGVILSLSRAIGESAPLIVIGAATYIAMVPSDAMEWNASGPGAANWISDAWTWLSGGFRSEFTAMPIQIYHWSELPQPEYRGLAAAAIIVLLCVLLSMNAVAIAIRTWQQRSKA